MPAPSDSTDAPVVIAAYDPRWPALFATEHSLLSRLLAPWLVGPIEHIGSTAVIGLAAKPVIDIMAAVESLAASTDAIAALRPADYLYAPYRAEVMHWFCKPHPSHRTHHLHLVPHRSPLWNERLAFRDRLRADPLLAREYADLKHRLAAAHPNDRDAYTDAKTPFIRRVLAESRPS